MAQYYDSTTGRPLPTPSRWLGTSHLQTEDQWYRHLRNYRDRTGAICVTLSVLGSILFVTWPAPGFGQAIAIVLWLWALLMSPLYFMYNKDLKRYFGDKL
jgi:hypothetical protein